MDVQRLHENGKWISCVSTGVYTLPNKKLLRCSALFYKIISSLQQRQQSFRSSRPEVLCKQGVLEISQNSHENTCARVSFLIKLQAWGLQIYLKRDSGTGVFLWIFQNFWEHLFLKNSSGSCFLELRHLRFSLVEQFQLRLARIKSKRFLFTWAGSFFSFKLFTTDSQGNNHTYLTDSQYSTFVFKKYSIL